MQHLASYVGGQWVKGSPGGQTLVNPATEEPLASASSEGIDLAAALAHARTKGGPALRALSFAERGAILKGMADALQAARDELLALGMRNCGNTRADAKFDVDGAIATLLAYAELGTQLGAGKFIVDGEGLQLGRSPRSHGQHVSVPRHGVAVHINAFNFPAWGLAEKAAEKKLLPEGALSLLVGAPRDLAQHLGAQDVLAFTGSGDTGGRLRALPNVIRHSVRVNVEADSLNAAVLGPDAGASGDMVELFLKEVVRDITQKAGQKCTAIRRLLVPAEHVATLRDDLAGLLSGYKVGDPADEEGAGSRCSRRAISSRPRCSNSRRAQRPTPCTHAKSSARWSPSSRMRRTRRPSSPGGAAASCARSTRRTRPGWRKRWRASRRTTAVSTSDIRRSNSPPGPAPCCRNWCTVVRDARAAARNWAAGARSAFTCSASRCRARDR